MKIELKNIKRAEFASEETHCFEATIYIDGKKAGTARNDGHGGPTWIQPHELHERISAYAKTQPPIKCSWGGKDYGTVECTADYLIDTLVEDWLMAKDLRRLLSTKIVGLSPKGEVIASKKYSKETIAQFCKAKLPSDSFSVVFNYLPFDEAFKIYKEKAA